MRVGVGLEEPSMHWPWKKTLCTSLSLSMTSAEEKLISRETALH